MKRLLALLLCLICLGTWTTVQGGAILDGGGVIATEVDGDPLGFAYKIIWPNGTVAISNGVLTYTAAAAAAITVANEATDTTCFPVFVTAATGDLGPKSNAGLSFNSNTGMLTATGLTGPLTGNASTATALAANGANCSAGYAPLGVDASGAVESCWQPQPIDAMLTAIAALTSTEGSIVYFSAADTPVILAKGSAGQTLKMNAGATAPEWAGITTTSHSATEAVTAATLYGNFHNVTGAYTVTLPSAVVGYSATFNATTGAVFSVDCNGSDHFVLAGTALTAGNKLTSSGLVGDQVEVICTAANTWTVRHVVGVFIDGGA